MDDTLPLVDSATLPDAEKNACGTAIPCTGA